MAMDLTPRMKNWIEALGLHVATATKDGFPTVTVSLSCQVEGSTIRVPLTKPQIDQISANLAENPKVAAAPGQLGSVRAPYQFKGLGKISGQALEIQVDEIYCTKPGAEAGVRLDTMGFEKMKEFEESRWMDITPPGA